MSQEENQQAIDVSKPATDAELRRENERLKSEVQYRKDQINVLLRNLSARQDADKARDEVELETLISNIIIDCSGKWTHDELKQKTKDELNAIREHQTRTLERSYASVQAEMDAASRKKEPLLTVGAWDSKKKDWVGGV